ncbi:YkvA family protein [Salinicola sp. LHM]|uniref:YkvA family protein n=1 Tax=Salinicola sp. LHM TaxID=3065298 RepID=UPI002ACE7707|nr:YkvA family protein [Salinicola sp. LHM]WQH32735.1 YkvA family protein [Salinicola sp. LHM]
MKIFSRHSRRIEHDDTLYLPADVAAESPRSGSEAAAKHQDSYSDERFWGKLTRFGKRAGREVASKALQLYFVLKRPDVPLWAKSTIIGALGYFISPLDAIPDFVAGVGYTDDASVLAAALVAVSIYIDEDIKRQAESVLARWWPEDNGI